MILLKVSDHYLNFKPSYTPLNEISYKTFSVIVAEPGGLKYTTLTLILSMMATFGKPKILKLG